ncbi:capsule biosynthesis protein [Paracoccus pacificus]|uniref:Capsule biosynthesis protein n=1 Tax=Paracoccus pacificus TaxID=1463598 RepID=A0ABW4RBJ0_9RHOB
MTIPPKARVFRIRRSDAPANPQRDGETAPAASADAANTPEQASQAPDQQRPEAQQRPEDRAAPENPAGQHGGQQGGQPGGPPASAEQGADYFNQTGEEDGFADMHFPTRDAGGSPGQPPQSTVTEEAIAAVRAENLTARQLRMALRIAAQNGIDTESELEAVVLLRRRGIDPFHRDAIHQLVAAEAERSGKKPESNQLVTTKGNQVARRTETLPAESRPIGQIAPQRAPQLPPRETLTEERRAAEILKIQRDIAKRRRWRLAMLLLRVTFFVFIPTALAVYYYFNVATPLYATESQYTIQSADMGGAGSEGAGILSRGAAGAAMTDPISVQNYLSSRDAMLRLDADMGFRRTFSDAAIDPILRLPENATNEETYKLYQKMVKIGFDPSEGIIKMEVQAPDPKLSEQFSLALIGYAEEQVDKLTLRLRGDQMKGAQDNYNDAETRVAQAQEKVLELQKQQGVLDPTAEGGIVMSRISTLEADLQSKRLELGQLLSNARPNQSRVAGVRGDIVRLEEMLQDTRSQLTADAEGRNSIAAMAGALKIAEADLTVRQTLLASAAEQLELARVEAQKQVRYLSINVTPVPPDEPTYPKAFQNSIVAFLIFSGIYLMLSLTVSILREQVSA